MMKKNFRLEGTYGDVHVSLESGGHEKALASMTREELEKYRDDLVAILAEIDKEMRSRSDNG